MYLLSLTTQHSFPFPYMEVFNEENSGTHKANYFLMTWTFRYLETVVSQALLLSPAQESVLFLPWLNLQGCPCFWLQHSWGHTSLNSTTQISTGGAFLDLMPQSQDSNWGVYPLPWDSSVSGSVFLPETTQLSFLIVTQ